MSVVNGVILAPINIKDTYVCLGVGQYNGWYDLAYICSNQHGRTNIWSKWKPVIVDTPKEITEEQLKAVAYGLQWYQSGDSLTYSIRYLPPVSGVNWQRLTDFIGYNHTVTSGLGWKVTAVTKDLISNYSDLTLYVENDSNKITVYDLKDTMFKGCKLQLNCLSRSGTSIYTYTESKDITSNMSFTIPISAIKALGVGEFSAVLRIQPSGYPTGIRVLTHDICIVNVTAETGLTTNGWNYNNTLLKTNTQSWQAARQYHTGVITDYLRLSDSNLLIDGVTVYNNSGKTFTQEDLKLCSQWTNSSGQVRQYYSYIYMENSMSWSVVNGSATSFIFRIDNTQLPKYSDTTTGYVHVKMFLVFRANIGGVYSNVRVSDVLDLNIARNNGNNGDPI